MDMEIYLVDRGKRVAYVGDYDERDVPPGVYASNYEYEIGLEDVRAAKDVGPLYNLDNFRLVIDRGDGESTVYYGCRWVHPDDIRLHGQKLYATTIVAETRRDTCDDERWA